MENLVKDKQKAIQLANKLGQEAAQSEINKMEAKLPNMKKGPVAKIWHKVSDIYSAFMSDETPASVKALLIGSLLYLVLPIDVVPDFIPVAGLLDDVAVLTYAWTKLSKLGKLGHHIAKPILDKTVSEKVQSSITIAYKKAFEFGKIKLEEILEKKAKHTVKNSIISLSLFVVAVIFLSFGSQEGALIASIIIIFLVLRTLFTIIKALPMVFRIIKIYFREKNIDETIASYMKETYPFIAPIETLKNKVKFFKDVPDLKELVYLQRQALKKTILKVVITVALAIALAFLFKRVLIFYTDYNFVEILYLPFAKLISLFS